MPSFHFLQQLEKQYRWLKRIPLLPLLLDEQLKVYTLLFRPAVYQKMMDVVHTIKQWDGITTHYHRYGGLEFRVNGRELAHIHGNGLLDVLAGRQIRTLLIEKQAVHTHHTLAESGWVSLYITRTTDIRQILTILQWLHSLHTCRQSVTDIAHEIETSIFTN